MANIFLEGFDHQANATDLGLLWNLSAQGAPIAGPFVGNAWRLQSGTSAVQVSRSIPARSTYIVGARVRVTGGSNKNLIGFGLNGATSYQCIVALNGSLNWQVWRGAVAGGTLLGQASATATANVYAYVEFKCTFSTTVGSYELRVNSQVVLSGSGLNTAAQGGTTANVLSLCQGQNLDPFPDFDDLYLNDDTGGANNSFMGDVLVYTKPPTGVGASAMFTPNGAASNWDCVNDATQDGDATYTSSNTLNDIDSFATAGDIPQGVVKAVQVNIVARKDDAGTRGVTPLVRSGGANYLGASELALGTSYVEGIGNWDVDPATSAAWTLAAANAAQPGYKNTT